MKREIKITKLCSDDARSFFMREESYSNILLPKYYQLGKAIKCAESIYSNLLSKRGEKFSFNDYGMPRSFGNVNYTIIANKDGRYAWRPLTFINPLLYVDFVYTITKSENWDEIRDLLKKRSEHIGDKILNAGMPVAPSINVAPQKQQILEWWQAVEQKSIIKSLEFECLCQTDITNFYGSIYTHTLVWAFTGINEAKLKKYKNLNTNSAVIPSCEDKVKKTPRRFEDSVGSIIDEKLMNMSYGETNGIPQGSVLMDFVAEILLSYADEMLYLGLEEENIKDYYIIRYRDDYRIFVNSKKEGEVILKKLAEIMLFLHLKLNPSKTFASYDVVQNSIKKDKLAMITSAICDKLLQNVETSSLFSGYINPQRILLQIYDFSVAYQNSGQLKRLLSMYDSMIAEIMDFNPHAQREFKHRCITLYKSIISHAKTLNVFSGSMKSILRSTWKILKLGNADIANLNRNIQAARLSVENQPKALIALLANIAYSSPSAFPIVAGIISRLLVFFDDDEKVMLCMNIRKKFSNMPNCDFIDLWLQRITCKIQLNHNYEARICKLLYDSSVQLWDYDWVSCKAMKQQLTSVCLVDQSEIQNITSVIMPSEYNVFLMDGYSAN